VQKSPLSYKNGLFYLDSFLNGNYYEFLLKHFKCKWESSRIEHNAEHFRVLINHIAKLKSNCISIALGHRTSIKCHQCAKICHKTRQPVTWEGIFMLELVKN